MASNSVDDIMGAVHRALHSEESSAAVPSSTVATRGSSCHSSVFSSPVSDLALNLEVLSTDGISSQGSTSTDGYVSSCCSFCY